VKLNVTNSGGSYKPPKKARTVRRRTGSANAVEHRVYPRITRSKPRRRTVRRAPAPKPRRRTVRRTSSRTNYVRRVATRRRTSSAPKRRSSRPAPKPKKVQRAAPKPAPKPKAPPKPVVPDANKYLGQDTTYQSQIAQLRKAYTDYVAGQNNEKTNYGNTYALNKRGLTTDKTNAFTGLQDDYASRGLLQSGVYGKAYSDLQGEYSQRQAAMDTERTSFLNDLATNLKTFQGDQTTTTTSARQEALARRAAKYNLKV
jgi:hypothetical protein